MRALTLSKVLIFTSIICRPLFAMSILDNQLLYAIKNNNMNLVKQLVDKGADVNAQYQNGLTPLHWTAIDNYTDMANFLIQKGQK